MNMEYTKNENLFPPIGNWKHVKEQVAIYIISLCTLYTDFIQVIWKRNVFQSYNNDLDMNVSIKYKAVSDFYMSIFPYGFTPVYCRCNSMSDQVQLILGDETYFYRN